MMAETHLLLAARIELLANEWVAILFVLFTIGSWIVNLINSSKQPPAAKPQPQRPAVPPGRRGELQSEIDEFLRKTRQGGHDAGKGPAQGQEIEVVRRAPPPKRSRTKQEVWQEQTGRESQQPRQKNQKKQSQKRPTESRQTLAQKLESRPAPTPGTQLTSSIQSSIGNRGQNSGGVGQLVTSHLGTFKASQPDSFGEMGLAATTQRAATRAAVALTRLQSPGGVLNAIMMQEILSKPLALRKR